ncbi:hypothetical protein AC622_13710 [Bacillus sp. FJAT-27916]|uniref:hypothetical protein n=1 Tax=Bacillaceae TaxID=186817 RepID=UPI000670FDA6|nr:hypothetical protein [Bacillus sp. FJAT-27916]KMY45154.1 hypothetical protein AC622_13710 [Bacillus sp. FJAT-27916]
MNKSKSKQYEMLYIPSKFGMIKVYIYGFKQNGKTGRVFIVLNGIKVNGKGIHKKQTLISTLSKFNEMIKAS